MTDYLRACWRNDRSGSSFEPSPSKSSTSHRWHRLLLGHRHSHGTRFRQTSFFLVSGLGRVFFFSAILAERCETKGMQNVFLSSWQGAEFNESSQSRRRVSMGSSHAGGTVVCVVRARKIGPTKRGSKWYVSAQDTNKTSQSLTMRGNDER